MKPRNTLTNRIPVFSTFTASPSGRFASHLFFATTLCLGLNSAQAGNKYWDTSAGLNNGVGGSGTWGTTFSTTTAGDASLTTAATTDDDIFQGTAGTITLSGSQTANSLTFNVTGFSITTSGSTTRILAGPITLSNSVAITLAPIAAATLTTSSISGGTSSALTIGSSTSAASDAIRINLAAGASIASSAPITISTSGTLGISGFVSNAGTATLNAGINNNSGVTTSLGATGSNTLNVNGAVTGSAGLQFSAGSGGGGGTINLNVANTYQGATTFNAASGALVKLGIDNALPTGTDVTMAASSSNGGILDLNGHNQEIASLTSGVGGGSITNGGASGTNTLKISGSASPAAFGLAITDGANAKTALIHSGSGTTILTSTNNSYTGGTQITGGTINVSGSLTGNGAVSLTNANSTLITGSATTISGTITANNGTIITIGGAGTVGTLNSGLLTLNGGSTLNFDLLGATNYDKITSAAGALTRGTGTETINIAGSGFTAGTYTLLSGYTSLGGSGAFALGSTPGGSFTYSLATGATATVLTVAATGGSGNLTWSLGGLAPTSSTDGAGTWTNGASNFYNTGTSSAITWDNSATNNLTIGSSGAGGIITLGGNVRVGGTLTFAAVSSPYTVGTVGGTNTLTLAGGITANNSATINAPTVLENSQSWSVANGKTLTANGTVSETGGARSIFKDGPGTLILAGINNSYSGGTTVNSGILSVSSGSSAGTSAGVMTVNSGATLAGAGTVYGTTSVTSGTIDGSGLILTGAVTFNNTGNTLKGTATASGGASLASGAALATNASSTLTVTGASAGVSMSGGTLLVSTTLTNSGTIQQTGNGRGVASTGANANLVIQNNSGALISTTANDGVAAGTGGATVSSVLLTNDGNIQSAGGNQAVNFKSVTGTNSVINTGSITAAAADAVRPGANGTVTNNGTIMSTQVSGSSSDGVDVQANTGVIISNASNWSSGSPTTPGTGTIEGGRHGITGGPASNIAFTTSITNNLGGIIQGDTGAGINLDGLGALQTATITNKGTITGNGRDIGNSLSHDGDGVDVDGVINLTNTGIIRSVNSFNIVAAGVAHSEGITVGGGTITNSGTIEGLVSTGNTNAVGFGITFLGNDVTTGPLIGTREAIYANATVTNQAGGLIRGDSASGIFVDGPASGFTVTIINNSGATIQGGGGTMAAIQTGADNDTINNAGLIDGLSSGKAIDMGGGNNTLNIIGSSASILGSLNGGVGGTNSLVINPGTGNSFSTSGALSNFSTTEVKSGTVTLGGTNTYTGATNVTGGKLVVNGNISTSVLTTVANSATLAGNGTVGATLIQDGGILAPGNSIGTITANSVSFESGSSFAVEINSTAKTCDLLILAGTGPGTLTIGTGAVLTLGELGTPAGLELRDRLTLVNYFASGANTGWNGGLLTYAGEELSDGEIFSALGYQLAINYDDTSNGAMSLLGGEQTNAGKFLTLTVVPEPSSAALLGGMGLIGLLLRRRKSEDASSCTSL